MLTNRHNTTTTIYEHCCRLCNHIIRNLSVSIVAEMNNLRATYIAHDKMESLGIHLFSGTENYDKTIYMTDGAYEYIIKNDVRNLCANVDANDSYLQTRASIQHLYNYLRREEKMRDVMEANPYKERYGNNNDCYVHVRLGDMTDYTAGYAYYERALSRIEFDQLFISSDSIDHPICRKIIEKYPTVVVIDLDEVGTIQFASTNKHIVLSCGTFSSVIGYLSFFAENIYYPIPLRPWHGDVFCIPGWKSYNVADGKFRTNGESGEPEGGEI